MSYPFYLPKYLKKKYILRNCIFNRNAQSKMDLTFTRTIMEYGCEVWNDCGVELTNKVQLVYASRDSAYLETGWEKLIGRRNRI
jgi:hypothetical protein